MCAGLWLLAMSGLDQLQDRRAPGLPSATNPTRGTMKPCSALEILITRPSPGRINVGRELAHSRMTPAWAT